MDATRAMVMVLVNCIQHAEEREVSNRFHNKIDRGEIMNKVYESIESTMTIITEVNDTCHKLNHRHQQTQVHDPQNPLLTQANLDELAMMETELDL